VHQSIFLHEHRISTARSVRIYRLYGSDAIRRITENPYRLARDVCGIGFLSADRIAAAFGIARDSLLRIQAGLSHGFCQISGQLAGKGVGG
jgi:exodeoxyribonuclease V alpha subunit